MKSVKAIEKREKIKEAPQQLSIGSRGIAQQLAHFKLYDDPSKNE